MEELTKNPLAIWWSMVSVKLIQRPAQNNKESTYIQAMQAPNLQELLKTFWIRQGSTFLSEKGRILRQVSWSFRYFECFVILSNMFCLYCNRYEYSGHWSESRRSQLWPKQSVDPARIRGFLALLLQGQTPSRATPDQRPVAMISRCPRSAG